MNLSKIKFLIENKKVHITQLSEKIDMSEQNLRRCIKKNNMMAADLIKIANVLEVPITYFFDDLDTEKNISNIVYQNNSGSQNIQKNVANIGNIDCLEKVKTLQKEIEHLNKIINLLEKK